MLLTATIPHVSWVRETSPPYGAPPRSSPSKVAHDLVDAWHALAQAESAVALAEGDTLRLVADQRLYLKLGFSSLHDFCVEAAEMTASTAKRRVATSRLAAEIPELRIALIEGKVSQCQALELRAVVTPQSASWWIALASRSTLKELRSAVREARRQSEPSRQNTGSSDAASEGVPEGSRVSIAAPVAARLAFEEGLEYARKMLGYDAPRHACIAAMLAEAAGAGLTAAARTAPARVSNVTPSDPKETDGWMDREGTDRMEMDRRNTGRETATEETPDPEPSHASDGAEIDSEPADARQRRLQRLARSQHPFRPFPISNDASCGTEETAQPSGARRHGDSERGRPGHIRPATSAAGVRPADLHTGSDACAAQPVSAFMRESITRAEQTISHVYEQLDSFRELLEETPTEADASQPASLVERLEEIRALAAPIHVLSLRILLHLEDLSASRYLGVRTNDALAETHLRISPRTFRQLLAEAWQMKRRPELESAYLSGAVGISRLRVLSGIESRRMRKFLARANRVTLRQMKRELRMREKHVALRDQLEREREAQERFALRHRDVAMGMRPGPNHDQEDRPFVLVPPDGFLDPFPGPGRDVTLACILLQHGYLANELERALARPGLCTAEEATALIAKARAAANRNRANGDGAVANGDRTVANRRNTAGNRDGASANRKGADASRGSSGANREGVRPNRGGADANGVGGVANRDSAVRNQEGSVPDRGGAVGRNGKHASTTEAADPGSEFELFQRDPAANPALMRRLEVLTDLALLVVFDDSVLVGSEVYPRGRQSLNLEGDFCRISFWAPDTVIQDLSRFLENLRERTGPLPAWASLMILVRDAVDVWKKVDRKKKPEWWRVFERDDYRCQAPACSKRADLHGHHIVFRSQGGSDDPSNVVSACFGHHQQGVHDGHLRCTGNANQGLRWKLGPRAKRGGPFRVYQGDLRID